MLKNKQLLGITSDSITEEEEDKPDKNHKAESENDSDDEGEQ